MTSQPSGEITATTAQRIGWAILILATLYICYFSHLGVIGFVGPDEPRYAWIARDMAETGDWVTPRLYGKPWFEKPVLYYWGAALSFKLFGVSEAAARLPSAISALLATFALAWLAWRTYGEECARWLLLLLPTSVSMIGFSHAAATDMPFAGMLSIAMVWAAVALGLTQTEDTPILPRTPWMALILFGFFLGLAVLAKGPAAVILSGGVVFFSAVFTKRWRDALRLLHPAAVVSFCLTAFPWYILCAHRNPDFFRVFIIEHNFKRYLTPEFQHVQPFWFYIPILILGLFPWIAVLVPVALDLTAIRHKPESQQAILGFSGFWILFPLLFFSFSRSKLPGYILPVFPPLALLMSSRVNPIIVSRKSRWTGMVMGLILIVTAFGIPYAVRLLNVGVEYGFSKEAKAGFYSALLGGLCVMVLSFCRRLERGLQVGQAVFLGLIYLGLAGSIGKILDQKLSARFAVERYFATQQYKKTQLHEPLEHPPLNGPFVYRLPRAYQYTLNFYFHRELPAWSGDPSADDVIFVSPRDLKIPSSVQLRCPRGDWFAVAVIPCETDHSLGRAGGRQPL